MTPNDERTHAGSMVPDCNQDALPAWLSRLVKRRDAHLGVTRSGAELRSLPVRRKSRWEVVGCTGVLAIAVMRARVSSGDASMCENASAKIRCFTCSSWQDASTRARRFVMKTQYPRRSSTSTIRPVITRLDSFMILNRHRYSWICAKNRKQCCRRLTMELTRAASRTSNMEQQAHRGLE